jgi:hypothetical protein
MVGSFSILILCPISREHYITQRMFESVPGGKFVIPDYWQEYKILERDWPKVLPKEFSREENQWLKPS